jgi:hypothetical protein
MGDSEKEPQYLIECGPDTWRCTKAQPQEDHERQALNHVSKTQELAVSASNILAAASRATPYEGFRRRLRWLEWGQE